MTTTIKTQQQAESISSLQLRAEATAADPVNVVVALRTCAGRVVGRVRAKFQPGEHAMPFLAAAILPPVHPTVAVDDPFVERPGGYAYAVDLTGDYVVRRAASGAAECAHINPEAVVVDNDASWEQITRGLSWTPCTIV